MLQNGGTTTSKQCLRPSGTSVVTSMYVSGNGGFTWTLTPDTAGPHLGLGIVLVMDCVDTSEYLVTSGNISIHEFGHLIGAKDHYGGENAPTTEEMNDQTNSGNLYNSYCIYGERRSELNSIESELLPWRDDLFCAGCWRDIDAYMNQSDY